MQKDHAYANSTGRQISAFEQANQHNIRFSGPATDFFEGALLGNGGLGVVVTTRPDAVLFHFGHNNVWDIRIAEEHVDEIMNFQEVFERFASLPATLPQLTDNPWYREYCEMAGENYSKPYPRPMPCGSLLLRYDRRQAEVLGHTLHIDDGHCTIDFVINGKNAVFEAFVEANHDRLWMRVTDPATGEEIPLFHEIALIPDPDTPHAFPAAVIENDTPLGMTAFSQILPYLEVPASPYVGHEKDKAFRLVFRASHALLPRADEQTDRVRLSMDHGFSACVDLREGMAAELPHVEVMPPCPSGFDLARIQTTDTWKAYWSCSSIALEDEFLEQIWYRNLYFLNCAVKAGVTCPGLFANWSYRSIGSDWHGDYHMNYNTQQPFWVTFSSNHLDKHLPYVDMVDHVLPVSQKWAKEYYGLRGAYFPHSAYPVDMTIMPYPVPHWGWEICETPWTVQSLWWHYLYSMDIVFLRDRAFQPIKEAVLFMVDYMMRPEARGDRWNDDDYHIFPTVIPELYEIAPGFAKNSDCLIDLTLTKFILHAYIQACSVLGLEDIESALLREAEDILHKFPLYPTAESSNGRVFVSVQGEDPDTVYNVPIPMTTVFPGEEHGLHSSPEEYQIAVNSYRNHRNEGGNELVFYPMAGARLGILDLEKFKRQITYCMLPNGTCTDRVLMSGGRYSDTTDFDFMSRMGVWFENFSLPGVINECLLQSYNGILRLFPNWPENKRAEFHSLRAVGGFLVSATYENGEVTWIEVISEAGSPLSFYIPWEEGAECTNSSGEQGFTGEIGCIPTSVGEVIRILKRMNR